MTFALSYTYRFGDYLESLRAKRGPRTWPRRAARYLLLNSIFLGSVLGFTLLDGGDISRVFDAESLPTLAAIAAGITVFGAVLDVLFEHWLPWFIYRQLAIRDKRLHMKIGEAISWSCNGLTGTVQWSSIERLVETSHGLFLFISKAEAFLVPRRAMPSEPEFVALAELARSKLPRA